MVRMLMDAGADVNAQGGALWQRTADGIIQRSQGNTDVVSRVTELEGHCIETSDRNMKK
jgi:hypothetical protein